MRDLGDDIAALSINTATVRKQHGVERPLLAILDACARHGIRAVSPWRDQVEAAGLGATARAIRAHGMALSGYCRGGLFTAFDDAGLRRARDDNRRAVDEACELGAACLVLVVGALPGALQGHAASKDLARARRQVEDGIAQLLEYAKPRRMPLAIEPLHPMYAADRACINTLEAALDVCDALDPQQSGALGIEDQDRAALSVEGQDRAALGVAVDLYHVWWDPKLREQIERAGSRRLLAFHVCDWLTPTTDLLNDRGMMGDGVIDIRQTRGWMEDRGFAGHCEVEIFSNRWWAKSFDEILATCIERHRRCV